MLQIDLYRNKQENSTTYGKVYGRVKNNEPIGIDELARHMSEHNTPYSKGAIKGILSDMAGCIKELMLGGQPVKLADLCIFKASAVSLPANDVDHFDLSKNIKSVKLTAVATGEITRKRLTEEALLGYTSMAQRLKNGEVELSINKNEYLVKQTADGNNGD